MEEFDIGVIGAGPGGISAAIEAASLGAKVFIAEQDELGGVCLNKGCIPTKVYLKSASLYGELKRASELGISGGDFAYDLSRIKRRVQEVVTRIKGRLESALKARKVEMLKGKAVFLDGKCVAVGEDKIRARAFIVATGSSPKPLESAAVDAARVFDSDGIFGIERIPKSVSIVGTGPIGCEFASFFCAFGAEVTLIEKLARILPKEDEEVSKKLEGMLEKRGVKILTSRADIDLSALDGELILISIGRSANIYGLGLEKAGVRIKDGAVCADEYLRANADNIFAVGDCAGKYNLAHVASAEGRAAARNALGAGVKFDYSAIANCVYSIPEVASVGLNALQAQGRGYEVEVGRAHFAGLGKAQAEGETEGFIKLVADKKSGGILGAQILGHCATELIGIISTAIKGRLKAAELADVIQAHPTFSEAIQEAAAALLRKAT